MAERIIGLPLRGLRFERQRDIAVLQFTNVVCDLLDNSAIQRSRGYGSHQPTVLFSDARLFDLFSVVSF